MYQLNFFSTVVGFRRGGDFMGYPGWVSKGTDTIVFFGGDMYFLLLLGKGQGLFRFIRSGTRTFL